MATEEAVTVEVVVRALEQYRAAHDELDEANRACVTCTNAVEGEAAQRRLLTAADRIVEARRRVDDLLSRSREDAAVEGGKPVIRWPTSDSDVLHVYAQDAPHDEVVIVGTVPGLMRLARAALNAAATPRAGLPIDDEVYTNDGEGYTLIVLAAGTDAHVRDLPVPYTHEAFADRTGRDPLRRQPEPPR